ncbi:MliC family protein (plasmid) [Tistrella bauzanensis]|uniref:MliC family protein n=1 Tax=Tistrella arctica TaxID=3133430 RepID=A0ABU9YP64_9PROT
MRSRHHLGPILGGLVIGAAILSGCAERPVSVTDTATSAPKIFTARYVCDDGSVLDVRFQGETATVATSTGGTVVLPQRVSGSGFRYADAGHSLRGKGRAANWTVDGTTATTCQDQEPD